MFITLALLNENNIMVILRQIPLLRLLIPLCAGILLSFHSQSKIPIVALILGLGLNSLVLLIIHLFGSRLYSLRWLYGFFLALWFILLGFSLEMITRDTMTPSHFQSYISCQGTWVVVVKHIKSRGNRVEWITEMHGIRVDTSSDYTNLEGRLKINVPSDSFSSAIHLFDTIAINGSIQGIAAPLNPNTFDYQRYMMAKNIFYQMRLTEKQWKLIGKAKKNVWTAIFSMRTRAIEILRRRLKNEREFVVASALVLGYVDEITEEVQQAYSVSGAMHVLAVSGLHVGIIYIVFDFLFFYLKKIPHYGKSIHLVILLLGIWLFVFLTGASPSALRAGVMFSLINMGKLMSRRAGSLNILAATAFTLLCYNPRLLLDVGFQLSFCAVAGILILHPFIHRIWYFPNRIVRYFWSLSSLSCSAQVTTFPLGVYYFHQFPTYFLITNLLVVPISTLLLPMGLLLLSFDGIPYLGQFFATLFIFVLKLMNVMVFWVEDLPWSAATQLWFDWWEVMSCWVIAAFFTLFLYSGKAKWVLCCLGILQCLALNWTIKSYKQSRQKWVIVYHLPGHTGVEVIIGKRAFCFSDAPELVAKIAQNHRYKRGVAQVTNAPLDTLIDTYKGWLYHKGFLHFDTTNLTILHKNIPPGFPPKTAATTWLITKSAPAIPDSLPAGALIILDGSMRKNTPKPWLDCYQTGVSGAYTLQMK